MTTANKLTIIGIIVATIGTIASIIQSSDNKGASISQSTTGSKSPAINTNGDVNLDIK